MEKENWFAEHGLMRKNYRGDYVPVGAGIFLILPVISIWGLYLFIAVGERQIIERLLFLTTVTGAVGLLDDSVGSRKFGGLAEHFGQLLSGNLTTGVFKAGVVFLSSFYIVIRRSQGRILILVVELGILLLLTNFTNLVDLRPGRALKFFVLFSLVILIKAPFLLIYLLPVLIGIIPYGYYDLNGRMMLGDTGANFLGIVLAYLFLNGFSPVHEALLLVILIVLTLVSEKYSFTEYIAGNRILNWLDLLGR